MKKVSALLLALIMLLFLVACDQSGKEDGSGTGRGSSPSPDELEDALDSLKPEG